MTRPLGRGRDPDEKGVVGFVLGGAAGLVSGVLLSRPGVRRAIERSARGAGMLLVRALRITGEGAGSVLGRRASGGGGDDAPTSVPAPDSAEVRAAVEGSPLSGRVRARVLGAGVVELTGTAEEPDAAARVSELERTLRELPGVDSVVNRVWTADGRRSSTGGG